MHKSPGTASTTGEPNAILRKDVSSKPPLEGLREEQRERIDKSAISSFTNCHFCATSCYINMVPSK